MPVNITEEFVRQLMAQIDFLTEQNSALTAASDSMSRTIMELNHRVPRKGMMVSIFLSSPILITPGSICILTVLDALIARNVWIRLV